MEDVTSSIVDGEGEMSTGKEKEDWAEFKA